MLTWWDCVTSDLELAVEGFRDDAFEEGWASTKHT